MNAVVYDGVFSSGACALLHAACTSRGLGHSLFHRGTPRSPVEAAVDSFLDELGDRAPFIEYWSRQEWKHIEAHADIDEKRGAAGDEPYRFPSNAHVAYLAVGQRVQGPTCIWEAADASEFGAMTVVPAVEGRVLRFDGRMQHAVPRPADVWLAPFVINQAGPPADFVRSVCLFNTWHEPPLGVTCEEVPDVGDELSAVRCAPRSDWSEAPIRETPPSDKDATAIMKVWLLGDKARRQRIERTRPLRVYSEQTLTALQEPRQVTRLGPPPLVE